MQDPKGTSIQFVKSLKACAKTKDLFQGSRIHAAIRDIGLLGKSTYVGNALVNMYAKCGALVRAQQVLNELPVRNVVTWSALIAGYVQNGHGKEALDSFCQMQREGLSPNAVTYVCILKACGIMKDEDMGKRIHEEIARQGLLNENAMLGSALVDMYVKCSVLIKARKVLDELPVRSVVSWSALIAGYAQHGHSREALNCFHKMRCESLFPDAITYTCTLRACGIAQDIDLGSNIHEEIASQGLLKENIILGSALVDMYARCGAFTKAQSVLDELPVRDAVAWSALIAGYAQYGHGQEALKCFHQMRREGLFPSASAYAYILKACGITQDIDLGKKIHDEIINQGLLKEHVVLGTTLVDMYAKCGLLTKAERVLQELPVRDVVSWSALVAGYSLHGKCQEALKSFQQMQREGCTPNVVSWSALIGGFAQQGLAEEALDCFRLMQQEGILPDAMTFVGVLNACSHSGLVDEGQIYFDIMREKYGIIANKEHYTCMVDLFGRAKCFDKAMRIIKMMPSSDYPPVWFALLGACQKWGNVELGRFSFERAVQLDRCNTAVYVAMSDIYAAAGMHEEAQNIEHLRVENAACEQPDYSCLLNAHHHVFRDTKVLQENFMTP